MALAPQTPEELLEIIKTPLTIFEKAGIHLDVESTVSGIAEWLPRDANAVIPWFERIWDKAGGITADGDFAGGIWDLIEELLNVAVELFATLVDLLRSLVASL